MSAQTLYLLFAVAAAAGAIRIIHVSIKHMLELDGATEVNVVWYAFSLVFVIRGGIDFAAYLHGDATAGQYIENAIGIPLQYTLTLHSWLTNVADELNLVAGIVLVAIAPQFATYLLAGLFGCAQSPPFVWYFEKFAAWSLIKFLAALAGISFEELFLPYAQPKTATEALLSTLIHGGAHALGLLAVAFALAVAQIKAVSLAEGKLPTALQFACTRKAHRWLTRNLPKKPSAPTFFDSFEVERGLRQSADSIRDDRTIEVPSGRNRSQGPNERAEDRS